MKSKSTSPALATVAPESTTAARGQDVAEERVERLTTWAPAGAASAISCAFEVPSGVASPVTLELKGLVMSTMTLPSSASPNWLTTGTIYTDLSA